MQFLRLISPGRSSLSTNSIYLIVSHAANALFGFLFWTVAARLYPANGVGLVAAAVSACGLLAMLSFLGLDYALIRFLPRSGDSEAIINSSLTIGAGMALMASAVFISGLGAWTPALLPIRDSNVFMAGILVVSVCTVLVGMLASVYLSRMQAVLILIQSVVFGVTRVSLATGLASTPRAEDLIVAWAAGLIMVVLIGFAVFLTRAEGTKFQIRPTLRREVINEMIPFAFANYLTAVLWTAPMFLLPLLVVNLVGPEANAYFYVATNVSGFLAMIPMAASMSLFAHGSHDAAALSQQVLESARFSLLLLVPAILGIFLLGEKVLLIFGRAYSQAGTGLLWILALSALPLAVNYLYFGVRRVQQRMAGVVASAVWVLIVTLGLSVVLLPRIGLLGAGIAWFAAQASLALVILGRFYADYGSSRRTRRRSKGHGLR